MDNPSGYDIFFRIWAVVGPLLAAAVSAWWSRRIHIQDRDYQRQQELDRESRQASKEHQEQLIAQRKEKYNEVKAALVDYMASSQDFLAKVTESIAFPSTETRQALSIAREKFSISQQIVILLGNNALVSSSIELWNAVNNMPIYSPNTPLQEDYAEKVENHQNVRAIFIQQAREFLSSLENNPNQDQ